MHIPRGLTPRRAQETALRAGHQTRRTRSVLKNGDQDNGRLPDRCVVTGRATEQAIRLRAVPAAVPELLADILGAPARVGRHLTLPVDEPALHEYRRRQRLPLGLAGAAFGLIGFGVAAGYFNWVGAVLIVSAVVLQARNRREHWVQVRTGGSPGDELIVLRAHAAFDQQAQRLYTPLGAPAQRLKE